MSFSKSVCANRGHLSEVLQHAPVHDPHNSALRPGNLVFFIKEIVPSRTIDWQNILC